MQFEEEQEHPARRIAREWLNEQGLRSLAVGVNPPEFEMLRSLIGYPAFGLFWSLLAHERAQHQIHLSNVSLASQEGVVAAAVLQGHIRALDQVRELLLGIADPHAQQGEEDNENDNSDKPIQ